ncbi:hypothetical protein HWV62_29400 [Athelia sp. TMB]|nr:hypothetical protein HWV62_29400 [Athelia sp. TMB]
MFSSSTLLSLLLITASVTNASPIQRDLGSSILKVASQLNLGKKTLVDLDRERCLARHHKTKPHDKRTASEALADNGVAFTAKVGFGSPATEYNLLIDTGSSNTWAGAKNSEAYHPTSTSKRQSEYIVRLFFLPSQTQSNSLHQFMSYGSGQMSGDTYTDQVTLGNGLVIKNQFIGFSTESQGFTGIDGILGLGPVELTRGTLSNGNKTVLTVMDQLYKQKTIKTETLGIYFAPSAGVLPTGELSFGDVDTSKVVGAVHYVPVTKNAFAGKYWGIDQSISYGGEQILQESAGIVDTGTTLVMISAKAFAKYEKATGGVVDSATGMLKITAAQFAKLKNLDFKIGTKTFSLIPDAQIWPRALNSAIGGDKNSIYLVVQSFGDDTGVGFEFINGFSFLCAFRLVLRSTNTKTNY